MTRAIVAIGALAVPAAAEHDDMVMAPGADSRSLSAGASLVAARFDTPFYVGDYEGVSPTVGWADGRWSAAAMLGLYRLDENGRTLYGAGDAMASVSWTAVATGPWRAGATVAMTLPTGDASTGLGMGHPMAMPAVWVARAVGRVELRAAVGYDRALASLAGHDHGGWPLVEPMNMQEVVASGGATVALGEHIAVAVRGAAGVPIGIDMGVTRITGAAGVSWLQPRMITRVELQAGLMGDPFTVRGIVETEVRF